MSEQLTRPAATDLDPSRGSSSLESDERRGVGSHNHGGDTSYSGDEG